jgi:hypothetical protein
VLLLPPAVPSLLCFAFFALRSDGKSRIDDDVLLSAVGSERRRQDRHAVGSQAGDRSRSKKAGEHSIVCFKNIDGDRGTVREVVLASDDFALFEDSTLFAKAMDTCCNQDSWIVPGMPFASRASSAPFFIRASFRKYFWACVRACVAFLVPTICAIPLKSFGPTACSASKNRVCSKSVQYLRRREKLKKQ